MTPKQLLVDLLSHGSNDLTSLMLCCGVDKFTWERKRKGPRCKSCTVIMSLNEVPIISIYCVMMSSNSYIEWLSYITISSISPGRDRMEEYWIPKSSKVYDPLYFCFSDHFQKVTGLNPYLLLP